MSDTKASESQELTSGTHLVAADGSIHLAKDSIILERYQVLGLLGQGGMGSVFHIRNLESSQEFALKVLARQSDVTTWRRFDNEAKAAGRLSHPNLIKVHESGLLPDGQAFFIMELVKGETLADLIKKSGRLPLQSVIKIFIQVGFALSYAHENGVIHRDLKPSNIMIAKEEGGSLISAVKVVDLGIAKLTGIDEFNQQTLTKTGEIFGSPLYMSPEQCMGIPVDTRTDLYSFGCSMYEALTGAPPLIGENALSTMMKHQLEKPLTLKEASLGIVYPQEIERLVARLLEKEPDKRFPNAQLLTHDLVHLDQLLSEGGYPDECSSNEKGPRPVARRAQAKAFSFPNAVVVIFAVGAFILGFATNRILNAPAPEHTPVEKRSSLDNSLTSPKREELEPSVEAPDKAFSHISADGKNRIFEFPIAGRYEVGRISDGTSNIMHARGRFVFPKESLVIFELNPRYMQNPDTLERFADDDITNLSLVDEMQSNPSVLSALPRFTRLRSLKIAMSTDDGAFHYIDEVPNLTELIISHTNFKGSSIAKMKRWSQLKLLCCNSIPEIESIVEKLPNSRITDLRIADNDLKVDDLKQIARMKNLETLSIGGNKSVNDDTIKLLTPLSNLTTLYVIGCQVSAKSAETLKSFKKLRYLEVSIADPAEFLAMKRQLEHVEIRNVLHAIHTD